MDFSRQNYKIRGPLSALNGLKGEIFLILDMQLSYFFILTLIFNLLLSSSCNESSREPPTSGNNKWKLDIENDAKKFPDSATVQLKWAEALINSGDTLKAIDLLLKFQENFPGDTRILNALSYSLALSKDTSAAVSYLEQSLSKNPNQPDSEMELAFLYQLQKNKKWETTSAEMIADKNNQIRSSRGYFIRGVFESNQNQIEKAIRSFDSSIMKQFTFSDAFIERSILLFEQNKVDESLNGLYQALELDRKNPDIYFLVGECLEKQNKNDEARNFYLQVLELYPSHQGALRKLNKLPQPK
jgi:tetratricopeptide (TPR) repeat protein